VELAFFEMSDRWVCGRCVTTAYSIMGTGSAAKAAGGLLFHFGH
jgi:hypothetical protein